jgi:hypothetical protein
VGRASPQPLRHPNPLWACPLTGAPDERKPLTEEREVQFRREFTEGLTAWHAEYEGCEDAAQLARSAGDAVRAHLTEWLDTRARLGLIPLEEHERLQLHALVQALTRWMAVLEELELPELPSDEQLEDEDFDGVVETLDLFSSTVEEIGDRVSEICEELYAMEVPGMEVPAVLLERE